MASMGAHTIPGNREFGGCAQKHVRCFFLRGFLAQTHVRSAFEQGQAIAYWVAGDDGNQAFNDVHYSTI